jgi:glycosyltransferase involved in cell wall biosynthesis
MMPAVSVVVPTYDRPERLGHAIASALGQTAGDLEVVVVDDGSPGDVVHEIVRNQDDARLRYVRQPSRRGVAAARNEGVKRATAPYIAFLDDDDEWTPQKLEVQTAMIRRSPPEVGGIYTARFTVDEQRHRATITRFRNECLATGKNPITTSSLLIKRHCLDMVGPFDETLELVEDYDLWIRVASRFRFEYVDEPLVRYHVHPHGISQDAVRWTRSVERLLAKHPAFFGANPRGSSLLYRALGVRYARGGQLVQARRALGKAIWLWPGEPRSYGSLALTLLGSEAFRRIAVWRDR